MRRQGKGVRRVAQRPSYQYRFLRVTPDSGTSRIRRIFFGLERGKASVMRRTRWA
jgi:hypothetical protein